MRESDICQWCFTLCKHHKHVLGFLYIFSWRDCWRLWVLPAADGVIRGLNVACCRRLSRVDMKTICSAADPQRCKTTRLWCRSSDQRGAGFYRFPSNHSTQCQHHLRSLLSWLLIFIFTVWQINEYIWKLRSEILISHSSFPSGKDLTFFCAFQIFLPWRLWLKNNTMWH